MEGGSAGASKRPEGMGRGERSKILAARRGEGTVTEKTSRYSAQEDPVDVEL